MVSTKIISDSDLRNYISGNSKSNKVEALLKLQIDSWVLVKINYNDLNLIKKKEFLFDGFEILVQFNPGRIVSSSAKVDAKSIGERPCFLCPKNLPFEQKGLVCKDDYLLLVNPFPIFEEHFTIPHFNHNPQEIYSNFGDMLAIAKELGEKYTLFYNGPQCGASAPDHMHFQASPKNAMPIENQTEYLNKSSENIFQNDVVTVSAITHYLRNLFLLESKNIEQLTTEFQKLYSSIKETTNSDLEPLMNIIVTFDESWRVYIFPRKAHRPKEFFLEGADKILLSPAAVDFGGLLITPREEDFDKITKEDIISIFQQTTCDDATIERIIKHYCK
ncbi:MAG: DUF4922 domain-containing protein [Bacteroidetes bacterium]|nr:DUF4922 domain-containing protein [Bacteroidota bacterium]MBU1116787.1 DUF4922 domain-containing protein [Bacteroidota bacterium]MBU1798374.1 DUF4922 domain-containing protein [Bacteroidota bacterium]